MTSTSNEAARRDSSGKLVAGGEARGRPKGRKNKTFNGAPTKQRVTEALVATGAEIYVAAVKPRLHTVLKELLDQAEAGNLRAIEIVMRHSIPVANTRVVRGQADLAAMPVEVRVVEIGRRLMAGSLSAEDAKLLTDQANAELQVTVLTPLRAAMSALRAGESAGEVLARLASAVSQLPSIEGESQRVD
jgi:hypothetical protein